MLRIQLFIRHVWRLDIGIFMIGHLTSDSRLLKVEIRLVISVIDFLFFVDLIRTIVLVGNFLEFDHIYIRSRLSQLIIRIMVTRSSTHIQHLFKGDGFLFVLRENKRSRPFFFDLIDIHIQEFTFIQFCFFVFCLFWERNERCLFVAKIIFGVVMRWARFSVDFGDASFGG